MPDKAFPADAAVYAPFRQDKSQCRKVMFPDVGAYSDREYGGVYRVTGTTAVAGTPDVPVARLVALMAERSKRVVRSQFSAPNGAYSFDNVAYGPWTIISWDHTGEYNAVIASGRCGDPM